MAIAMPARPEELTREFISALVGEVYLGVAVENARIINIRQFGEINVSTSARVSMELNYSAGAPSDLPARVLVKMSMGEDIPSDVWCGQLHRFYENEVEFYRRVRPEIAIETPKALGGRFDPRSKHYVLVLEDMTARSAQFGSMGDDIDLGYVQSGIDTYARLHAQFWNSSRLDMDLAWVPTHIDGPVERATREDVFEGVRGALAQYKYKREMLERMHTSEPELFSGMCAVKAHFATLPQTLLHGDAHLGNTYRLPDGTGGVYDWQAFSRGFGLHDVTYFIITCLSVDMRRKHERELLSYYRDRLGSHGITDLPTLEMLWLEYRRMASWCFCPAWLSAPPVNYGWELTLLALTRTSTAYEDLETKKAIETLL